MSTDLQATAQRYPSGLTILSEEEKMFRDMVGKFSEKEIGPLVSKMDGERAIEPSLIPKLFEIGLMGIEVPETYGGSGSSFFMAVLAVEQISRGDASLGVPVDLQNTLGNHP